MRLDHSTPRHTTDRLQLSSEIANQSKSNWIFRLWKNWEGFVWHIESTAISGEQWKQSARKQITETVQNFYMFPFLGKKLINSHENSGYCLFRVGLTNRRGLLRKERHIWAISRRVFVPNKALKPIYCLLATWTCFPTRRMGKWGKTACDRTVTKCAKYLFIAKLNIK